MINQVFGETTSFFGQTILLAVRVLIWIASVVLRITLPFVLFGIVLMTKGAILFAILLIVTLWTYWSNIGILHARIKSSGGLSNALTELRRYGFATPEELRFQSVPFSVTSAVEETQFYRRFISFVDTRPTDQITIQNFMSLGWIAQVLDSGLTHIVKLAMPLAIQTSNLLSAPLYMVAAIFS